MMPFGSFVAGSLRHIATTHRARQSLLDSIDATPASTSSDSNHRFSTFDCRWSFHTNHQYISCNISMTISWSSCTCFLLPSSLRTWKARARGAQAPELSWSLFCRAMRKVHWKAWRRRETAETAEIFRNPGEWDTLPETKHNFHLEDESFLQKETHLPTNPSVF